MTDIPARTIPRGPIAAMYNSPGPQYGLPGLVGEINHDPRSVHTKKPAYSFGLKHGKYRDDCGPGPSYLLSNRVFRDGLVGTPSYSLYGRHRDQSSYKTPGPGTYKPSSLADGSKPAPPSYSFGSRHRNRQTDNCPGPNAYNLPTMIGPCKQGGKSEAPMYSLTGRSKIGSFHEDLQKTPGPSHYPVVNTGVYKNKPPGYSMTSRNAMPGDSTTKPGPGVYSPENIWVHRKQQPRFSFGIRHSPYTAPLIVDVQD
ncbi:outer dense fiber protein 3 [Patella vulgata]|uniref:outer dense fiber protein 3 n=1 Tax=Patella vulgata TaxID=6465 RepID=UPI0024A8667E|nr:outer dense fiber protein 3 [Patella vulgata]